MSAVGEPQCTAARCDGATLDSRISRQAWLVLFLVSAVYVISYIDRQIFALFLPDISKEFGLTDTEIGQLTGIAFPAIYGTMGVAVAIAADRINRAKLIAISTGVFSVMTMACGMAYGFWSLFLARLGVGLGEAGPNPPSLSLIAEHFKGPSRQVANSIFAAASSFGLLGAFLVFGNISVWYGWRTAFFIAGGISLVIAICVAILLKDNRRNSGEMPKLSDFKGFPDLFRIPSFRWAAAAAIMHSVCTQSNIMWLPLFLSRSLGMDQAEISWFLGLNYSILGLLGIAGGAFVATRLRAKSVGGPQLIGCAITITIAAAYAVAYLSGNILVSQIGLAIVILLAAAGYGPLLAYVQDVTPAYSHAKASAMLFFLMQSGGGAGSFLIGVLSDALVPIAAGESLRFALLPIVTISGLLASAAYFMAFRSGDRDAARAAEAG